MRIMDGCPLPTTTIANAPQSRNIANRFLTCAALITDALPDGMSRSLLGAAQQEVARCKS
jgi:hypothetical protein